MSHDCPLERGVLDRGVLDDGSAWGVRELRWLERDVASEPRVATVLDLCLGGAGVEAGDLEPRVATLLARVRVERRAGRGERPKNARVIRLVVGDRARGERRRSEDTGD